MDYRTMGDQRYAQRQARNANTTPAEPSVKGSSKPEVKANVTQSETPPAKIGVTEFYSMLARQQIPSKYHVLF